MQTINAIGGKEIEWDEVTDTRAIVQILGPIEHDRRSSVAISVLHSKQGIELGPWRRGKNCS